MERYSELVAAGDARLVYSSVRLFLSSSSSPLDQVVLEVHNGRAYSFESGHVVLPAAAAHLDDEQVARLALDVCHQACVTLADTRGTATETFVRAYEQTVADGDGYVWTTRWKASPDRKRQARAAMVIEADGWARVWIEVGARGEEAPTGASAAASGPGNCVALKRVIDDLRWVDAHHVIACTSDAMGHPTDVISVDVDNLEPLPQPAPRAYRPTSLRVELILNPT